MRWLFVAATAAVAATLWLPGQAAQPAAAPATAAATTTAGADAAIGFAQYRDWRLRFNARRRDEIAAELAEPDLPAPRKARLEQVKAYYDRLAGLSDADRDRRFRDRFERIDTDHDGQIDAAERAAWRAKRRAYFRRDAAAPAAAAAAR